jgi:cyclase
VLKVRVIPTLLYKDAGLVKGRSFDSWRPVGAAMQAIKVYEMREVDELIFVDIAATLEGRPPDFALVDDLADECFMPMTVGGGVRTAEDVGRLLQVGADKVAVNSHALGSPELISSAARRFGAQCIVASIDARRAGPGRWDVCTHAGTRPNGHEVVEQAKLAESWGAGEVLLTSIDLDGTMEGYDLEMVEAVTTAVGIPVIASGGCGKYEDMAAAVQQGGASAVAAASIFHFTHQTPLEAKRHMAEAGIPVRL